MKKPKKLPHEISAYNYNLNQLHEQIIFKKLVPLLEEWCGKNLYQSSFNLHMYLHSSVAETRSTARPPIKQARNHRYKKTLLLLARMSIRNLETAKRRKLQFENVSGIPNLSGDTSKRNVMVLGYSLTLCLWSIYCVLLMG